MENNLTDSTNITGGEARDNHRWWKVIVLVGLFALILANLVYLNYREFFVLDEGQVNSSQEDEGVEPLEFSRPAVDDSDLEETIKESTMAANLSEENSLCPEACLAAISSATVLKEPVVNQTAPDSIIVKELYIPLGGGSTNSQTYEGLEGIEAVIDTANYPNAKQIIFEATLRIPTANGKVYAKLYNVSDKHDVWHSEVSAEGSQGYRAESEKISLSQGRKLYRVMVKSTMGYEAKLDTARIKIILE
ncbi:hypothetical protein ACFL0Y_02585 [Patescibacteria group bacterium]